ncbi:MAG: hypothetical protein C5B58_07390, partial [Acidobacteria bacterium]
KPVQMGTADERLGWPIVLEWKSENGAFAPGIQAPHIWKAIHETANGRRGLQHLQHIDVWEVETRTLYECRVLAVGGQAQALSYLDLGSREPMVAAKQAPAAHLEQRYFPADLGLTDGKGVMERLPDGSERVVLKGLASMTEAHKHAHVKNSNPRPL